MTLPWYKSRTMQAAVVGGVFLLVSTIVAGYFASKRAESGPSMEIRSIESGQEKVLATLALRPQGQIVDSAAFSVLGASYVMLSDTFGIAILKPTEYRWTAGPVDRAGDVSLADMPVIAAFGQEVQKLWKIDTTLKSPRYGVRLDLPFEIRLNPDTRVNGIALGDDPFSNPEVMRRFEDYMISSGAALSNRVEWEVDFRRWIDSALKAGLPVTRHLYSGVFVEAITAKSLPEYAPLPWQYLNLFDKVLMAIGPGIPAPNVFYADRKTGTAAINQSLLIEKAEVNGKPSAPFYLNRVAYLVQGTKVIYLVSLQYLSFQDEATLRELERFFKSVRLRVQ